MKHHSNDGCCRFCLPKPWHSPHTPKCHPNSNCSALRFPNDLQQRPRCHFFRIPKQTTPLCSCLWGQSNSPGCNPLTKRKSTNEYYWLQLLVENSFMFWNDRKHLIFFSFPCVPHSILPHSRTQLNLTHVFHTHSWPHCRSYWSLSWQPGWFEIVSIPEALRILVREISGKQSPISKFYLWTL